MKKPKLNLKQELFCQLYTSDREMFGNGVQAYIQAYDIDTSKKGAYNTARASASDNLSKPNIIERVNELLEEGGLTDEHVDKRLLFLINQGASLQTTISAIKEYNSLKRRIGPSTVVNVEVTIQEKDRKLSDDAINQFLDDDSGTVKE